MRQVAIIVDAQQQQAFCSRCQPGALPEWTNGLWPIMPQHWSSPLRLSSRGRRRKDRSYPRLLSIRSLNGCRLCLSISYRHFCWAITAVLPRWLSA